MSGEMQRIRDFYDVPAKGGMQVKFRGRPVQITGAMSGPMYLHARDENGKKILLHPTWEIEYPCHS